MSQNKVPESHSGALETQSAKRTSSALGWVKLIGGALLLVVGLVLLLKLAGFLFKWAIVLLLIYGGYRLVRHLFSDKSAGAPETVFELEDAQEDSALALLENERELEALKVKMQQGPGADPKDSGASGRE